MPTPFYHLSVAEELLLQPSLPDAARRTLESQRSAFLFGNTAPDVQVVSHQTRQDTHFFDLPLRSVMRPPWEQLVISYPALAQPAWLPDSQAAFVAGYMCHLRADWLWIKDIFVPVFGLRSRWGTFPQRLYLHNVLRSYLDRQILPTLMNGVCAALEYAAPSGWLPFVLDEHLVVWRDFLTSQLQPEAFSQTVEVFAARQGIPPAEFYQLLDSAEAMDQEVFSRLQPGALDDYRQRLVQESTHLLSNYFLRN